MAQNKTDMAAEEKVTDVQVEDKTTTTETNDQSVEATGSKSDDKVDDPESKNSTNAEQFDKNSDKPRQNERQNNNAGRRKRAGNKSSYDSIPESKDEVEIRNQVEFYFSDSNLPTDAYLLKLTGGSENIPVPLKTIHDFKRMRHFQPFSAVRDAVKASKHLILSDDDQITRITPLDSKYTADVGKNSKLMLDHNIEFCIYAKGFGEEYSTLQLDIENFFRPYGPFKSVRMRRTLDGSFKGSVFVEFDSEELANQFLALDPKPRFERPEAEKEEGNKEDTETKDAANDSEVTDSKNEHGVLKIMSKREYVESKREGLRDGTVTASHNSRDNFRAGRSRGGGRGRGGRGRGGNNRGRGGRRDRDDDVDRDDWRERRNRDQGKKRGADEADAPEAKKQKASED